MVITAFVFIVTSIIYIPVVDQQQAHEILFDSNGKVKEFVKHIVNKICNRDGSDGGECGYASWGSR